MSSLYFKACGCLNLCHVEALRCVNLRVGYPFNQPSQLSRLGIDVSSSMGAYMYMYMLNVNQLYYHGSIYICIAAHTHSTRYTTEAVQKLPRVKSWENI